MVQSLGISLGNSNSYVAAGLGGGIEILLNDHSSRQNPSMVAFSDHSRSIGVEAQSNFFMNLSNTIYDLLVLLGKPYKDIETGNGQQTYPFKLEEGQDGQATVVVRHLGRERKFTITQVLGMLFSKLKSIAQDSSDCVISCPQFFNDVQKEALVQAAFIGGLSPLQIISDMSAVVLYYAYYRTTKEDAHKFIAFINFGQSNLQTTVAWLTPRDDVVRILASESEQVGGRDFDRLLAQHFVEGHKLKLTLKSFLKLVDSCEKLKRLLSANTNEIPINVESLISEDKDFSARIDRATFESMSQGLLQRVEACFKRTLEVATNNYAVIKADLEEAPEFELQAVEVVGGSTRMPAVKQLIQQVFNITPSTTLNTDEAVVRGCTLHCANLHPGIKVKRKVVILDSETFFESSKVKCDKDARYIELDLMVQDRKYKTRTEARNNLEEYIYLERSKTHGDQFMKELTSTLEWLFTDEGEEAPEETYNSKLDELRKGSGSPIPEVPMADATAAEAQATEKPAAEVPASEVTGGPEPTIEEPDDEAPVADTPMAEANSAETPLVEARDS